MRLLFLGGRSEIGRIQTAQIKAAGFEPEYAGKLNFYLNVVNAQLKQAQDQPSIGILLCKTPDKVIVEYALENILSHRMRRNFYLMGKMG